MKYENFDEVKGYHRKRAWERKSPLVAFKIDESLIDELDNWAERHKLTRSSALRFAVREFLENHND